MTSKHPSNNLKALLHHIWSGTESGRDISKQEFMKTCKASTQKEMLSFQNVGVDTEII